MRKAGSEDIRVDEYDKLTVSFTRNLWTDQSRLCGASALYVCLRGRVGQVARRHASLHTSLVDLGFEPRKRTRSTQPYIPQGSVNW
jgi:hypothetical protein